jgi:hypothetical protein
MGLRTRFIGNSTTRRKRRERAVNRPQTRDSTCIMLASKGSTQIPLLALRASILTFECCRLQISLKGMREFAGGAVAALLF